MSKGEPIMADVLALLSPPKKLKFDNVKSVAANIFDSTSQIASDINNERTSSVLSNEYSKASPVKKKKKKRKERQSDVCTAIFSLHISELSYEFLFSLRSFYLASL